jgi:flagellar biosynthesis protein FliR
VTSLLETLQNVLAGTGLHIQVQATLLLFGLIFTRVIGSLALAPFLGGSAVPMQIKAGLSFIVAAVLFPSLTQSIDDVRAPPVVYIALLAKEAVVGAMIGFVAQLVFYGIQTAGILIDTQRGMNQITYLAPQLPGHVSALGNLKFQASLALFLILGGHIMFLRALATSFTFIPILGMPHMHGGLSRLADHAIRIGGNTILIGFQLSAPIVLAIFLVDVSFGCIGKVASQVRLGNDANTAKSWIGLAIFFVAAAFLIHLLPGFFESMFQALGQLLKNMA